MTLAVRNSPCLALHIREELLQERRALSVSAIPKKCCHHAAGLLPKTTLQRIDRRVKWSQAANAYSTPDRTLMVKISLAKMSGSLDLSWLGLDEVPDDIFEIPDLEILTLAGNRIKQIPAKISQFKSLKKLQAAGNLLTSVPIEVTQLTELEEVWFHGNVLEELPDSIGNLVKLRKLSLAGNRLAKLPASLAKLTDLTEITASGNLLQELPACLGSLDKLITLSLNGNSITHIMLEIGQCTSLKYLHLQTNKIQELPEEIMQLKALEEFNLSDNQLEAVPESWRSLEALKMLWLYGNRLTMLPSDIFQLPQLECIWAEGNPLERDLLQRQLSSLQDSKGPLREVGLDLSQVEGLNVSLEGSGNMPRIRLGEVLPHGPGYFKLRRGGDLHHSPDHALVPKVLVVTFASAPGTPNWGGVLNRIASEAKPEEKCFDILYVCDGGRSWYSAGDDGLYYWREQLGKVTRLYSRVLMLGDSMGATAALLFSDLATSVQVFTPQVDLSEASMRPGQGQEWLVKVKQRVLDSVRASNAEIICHSGTWEHDLEQAKLLPAEKCTLTVHHVDSHRLAFALDRQKKLQPTIRAAILKELGLYRAPRLANLL